MTAAAEPQTPDTSTPALAPPACPRCGGPMVAKAGRAGRFLGCRAWPRCKGSRGVGDLGHLPGEHPVAATRRLALERLRHTARAWSADDREDAAAEAVAVAVAGGWADRPTAWTFVARHALRSLRGWQVLRGRRYSSRNPTTPTAGPALLARDPATGDLAPASPSDWIEWSAAASIAPDPEAALDLAREYLPILEAGLDREGGPALVARLVAGGASAVEIARETGLDYSGIRRWIRGEAKPSAEAEDRLRALAASRRPDPEPAPAEPAAAAPRAVAALRRRGWSGKAIAEAVGASPSAVSLWARRACAPAPATAARLLALAASGAPAPVPPQTRDAAASDAASAVAARLRAAGWYGREVAALAGCSAAQARAWLAGSERPTGDRARRLLELDAAGAFARSPRDKAH